MLEAGVLGKARQPGLLEIDVVIVVEVVDADHLVAASQQDLGDMHADKAGGTGDENFHCL